MEAKYIINAIDVLRKCSDILLDPRRTSTEAGSLSAQCSIAAIALKVYSGIDEIQIEVENDHVPS